MQTLFLSHLALHVYWHLSKPNPYGLGQSLAYFEMLADITVVALSNSLWSVYCWEMTVKSL